MWRLAVSGQRLARHDEAQRWAELADAVVDRVAAPADLRSRFLRIRGALELARGEYAAAVTTYERALAQGGVSPGERAAALGGVSSVHVALGDNAAAERALLEALPLLERTLGPRHPELGVVLNNLGNVQSYQGRRAEALATFERGPGNSARRWSTTRATLACPTAVRRRLTARDEKSLAHTSRPQAASKNGARLSPLPGTQTRCRPASTQDAAKLMLRPCQMSKQSIQLRHAHQ